jgi:CheY-like chemotaxis protein
MLLIVDDDPRFLQQAERSLDVGRGVYFAREAAQAKELILTVGREFSLALIDLDLPGQDGFSLISELHRNFPGLPVIAMSGVVQANVLESARALGATDVLRKPIGPEWTVAIRRARAKSSEK